MKNNYISPSIKVLISAIVVSAASFPSVASAAGAGFGCVDNTSCQAYVGYGQVNEYAQAADQNNGNNISLFTLPVDSSGLEKFSPSNQPLQTSTGAVAHGLASDKINGIPIYSVQEASTSIVGTSSLGQLKGVANAVATTTGTSNFSFLTVSNSTTFANLVWGDIITLTSDTLPKGTIVPLNFQLNFDRNLICNDSPQCSAYTEASLGFTPELGDYSTLSNSIVSIRDSIDSPSTITSKSATFSGAIGQPYTLQGSLLFDVRAHAYYEHPSVGASIEAGHTANFYITPLSPDVSYTSASGQTYFYPNSATSVPEPFTIIGTLVGGTAAVRMRKKLKESVS